MSRVLSLFLLLAVTWGGIGGIVVMALQTIGGDAP
jgi:hypothetical protein